MTGQDLAILSLLRRPFSSLMVVVAITLAVLVSTRMSRFAWMMERQVDQLVQSPDILIMSKGERFNQLMGTSGMNPQRVAPFSNRVVQFLCTPKNGVKACVQFSPIAKYRGFPLMGLGPDFEKARKQMRLKIAQGQTLKNDFQVMVGASVPLAVSDSFSAELLANEKFSKPVMAYKEFFVQAKLKPMGNALDRGIYFTEQGAWDLYFWMVTEGWLDMEIQEQPIGFVWMFLKDSEKVIKDIETLTNQKTVLSATRVKESVSAYRDLTAGGRALALMAGLLMALLAVLGMAALLMSRAEHLLQQLAVLRALGKPLGFVASWLMTEGFLLSSVGVVLGSLLELLIPLSAGLPKSADFLISFNQSFFIHLPIIWVGMIVLGTLSGLPVLWRLKRMDVHEALRHI